MTRFSRLALAAIVFVQPLAATAQDGAPSAEVEDGFNLIDEGAKLLLRGLQDEMRPMMEEFAGEMAPKMREFAEEFMPMLEGFSDLVGDLDAYHPPEKLPNGDIILRRKEPLLPESEEAPEAEGGEVEL